MDQSEDAYNLSRLLNLQTQKVLQGEPVIDVGEQVELRTVDQME